MDPVQNSLTLSYKHSRDKSSSFRPPKGIPGFEFTAPEGKGKKREKFLIAE